MTTSIQTGRPRHRFTVDEYHRMGEAGVFGEDDRVELLKGEIVEMTPIGSHHASKVSRLNRLFVRQVEDDALVWPQSPIQLGQHSEPEPDLVLLRPRDDEYADALPTADDALLVIEVADTSLEDDRATKIPLYADHDIPIVWIVNLRDQVVEVFEQPSDGEYTTRRTPRDDDALEVASLPDLALRPNEIFD